MTHERTRLIKKVWNATSRYVRLRGALETTGGRTHARCCTCERILPIEGPGCIQAGHFIPGRTGAVLFDLRGIHPQCPNCNGLLHGNWVEYERFMLKKYGPEVVAELKANKFAVKKWTMSELRLLLTDLSSAINDLGGG